MRKQYNCSIMHIDQRRSDYITYTCHIAEVLRITHYSNEICDKLKTTQTSKNIPFHLISVLFKRTLFPEYILACAFSACIPCDITIMAPTYY